MREQLEPLLSLARSLPIDQLPSFLGELETVRMTATARLLASAPIRPQPDVLLDVEAAAQRLGVSVPYVQRHHRQWSFTRREGRRLLFSSNGIDEHIRNGGSVKVCKRV